MRDLNKKLNHDLLKCRMSVKVKLLCLIDLSKNKDDNDYNEFKTSVDNFFSKYYTSNRLLSEIYLSNLTRAEMKLALEIHDDLVRNGRL